jgi:plasmid stabilization system protein ParE
MRYRIKYLPLANRDILEITKYLSRFSPIAATRILNKIETLIANLSQQPYLWEAYQDDPFYRRIVIERYLVFYHVNEDEGIVEVHRVLHGTRDLPRALAGN